MHTVLKILGVLILAIIAGAAGLYGIAFAFMVVLSFGLGSGVSSEELPTVLAIGGMAAALFIVALLCLGAIVWIVRGWWRSRS